MFERSQTLVRVSALNGGIRSVRPLDFISSLKPVASCICRLTAAIVVICESAVFTVVLSENPEPKRMYSSGFIGVAEPE